jgi:acetylcholinesterase
MESGGPYSRALHHSNSSLNVQQSSAFMSMVGCNDIACLRSVNETKLVNASDTVFDQWNPSLRWAWQPVIDGDLVPGRPLDQRTPTNIPILTGFSTNEGSLYVPRNLSTAKQFDSFFSKLLPQVSEQNISNIYPAAEYTEWRSVGKEFRRLEAAYGQYAYSCSVRQTASVFVDDADVYLFHWAVNRTVLGGAGHGDYISYETMDANVRAISPTQRQIATLFHGYITNFIITGNPNYYSGVRGPEWLPVQEGNSTLIFGLGNDERAGGTDTGVAAQFIQDDWAVPECDFWHAQSRKYED